jgi:hypothetical protein
VSHKFILPTRDTSSAPHLVEMPSQEQTMVEFLVYLLRSLGHPQWDVKVLDTWHFNPTRSRTANAYVASERHGEGESRSYAREGERVKDEDAMDRHR